MSRSKITIEIAAIGLALALPFNGVRAQDVDRKPPIQLPVLADLGGSEAGQSQSGAEFSTKPGTVPLPGLLMVDGKAYDCVAITH